MSNQPISEQLRIPPDMALMISRITLQLGLTVDEILDNALQFSLADPIPPYIKERRQQILNLLKQQNVTIN